MDIIYYSKRQDGPGKRIQAIIESQLSGDDLEVYRDLDSFSLRLCQPLGLRTFVVLTVVSRKDLIELLSISPLLQDLRIILALPDRREEERARTLLHPRYIAFLSSDYLDVEIASALKGMHEIISFYETVSESRRPSRLRQRMGLH